MSSSVSDLSFIKEVEGWVRLLLSHNENNEWMKNIIVGDAVLSFTCYLQSHLPCFDT